MYIYSPSAAVASHIHTKNAHPHRACSQMNRPKQCLKGGAYLVASAPQISRWRNSMMTSVKCCRWSRPAGTCYLLLCAWGPSMLLAAHFGRSANTAALLHAGHATHPTRLCKNTRPGWDSSVRQPRKCTCRAPMRSKAHDQRIADGSTAAWCSTPFSSPRQIQRATSLGAPSWQNEQSAARRANESEGHPSELTDTVEPHHLGKHAASDTRA